MATFLHMQGLCNVFPMKYDEKEGVNTVSKEPRVVLFKMKPEKMKALNELLASST